MKDKSIKSFFTAFAVAMLSASSAAAQGLFAKAAESGHQVVAAYESIWDSYYEQFGELLVADAVTEDGNLEFDAEHGLAHFPIRLKVNEDAYAKWLSESRALLEAAGIKEGGNGKHLRIGGKYYGFPDNAIAEIESACKSGEIAIPRIGVIVELFDSTGNLLQYAALPLGVFKEENKVGHTGILGVYPLRRLGRGMDEKDSNWPADKVDEAAYASVSFAGLTRNALQAVDKINCRVLVDPEFTKESRRLAAAKINADNKAFAEHGIETKVIMLPGDVPFAVNKTPRGLWFSRYEVTQDQWEAVMGNNPAVQRRMSDKPVEPPTDRYLKEFDKSSHHRINSPDMPVDCVSYSEVLSFVSKLNALPAVRESGLSFALPKGRYYHPNDRREWNSSWNDGQPDWEYACVGGKVYGAKELQEQGVWFGYDIDGNAMEWEEAMWNQTSDPASLHAKFGNWHHDFIHPVGMKRPNAFGLYDMLGNVGELVEPTKDKPLGNGRVKGAQEDKKPSDFTRSGRFYLEDDKHGDNARGFRLCAQEPGGVVSESSTGTSAASDVGGMLDEVGIKYRKGDGNFRVTYGTGEGRSQLAIIDNDPITLGDVSMREIYSFAARGNSRPCSEEEMRAMLKIEFGHWCLIKPSAPGKKWGVYHSVKIPANATPEQLKDALLSCITTADACEKDILGTDEN